MTKARIRPATMAITFAGQSLNNNPANSNSYPSQLRANELAAGRRIARYDAWIDGFPWYDLIDRLGDLRQGAKAALTTGVLMVGGTSDLNFARTGQQIYDDMATYAQAALAPSLGYDFVVAATITPSVNFVGQELVEWADANSRILTDVDGAFTTIVDLAADPRLDDPTDPVWYPDGTHPSVAGAGVIATLMATALPS